MGVLDWAFGGSAAISEPTEAKKALGFVVEKPSHETFNWLFNVLFGQTNAIDSIIEPELSNLQDQFDDIENGVGIITGQNVAGGFIKLYKMGNIEFYDANGNDPNGVLTAPVGSKAYNTDGSGTEKVNTDGLTTWA